MKGLIPLAAGLAIGILAIYYFVDKLHKARGTTTVETVKVVRARADIAPASEITEGMVQVVDVPKSLAPGSGFRELKEVVGRVTSQAIPQGVPVTLHFLAPPGTPPGMAVRIREGYRAVAVRVDESVGVAGWVKPDSHVDVVIVTEALRPGSTTQRINISRTLLQDLRVLAVGQDLGANTGPGASLAKTVTLEVTPEEAQLLHMAETRGRLRLAMRNPTDLAVPFLVETTDDDLTTSGRKNRPGSTAPPWISRLAGWVTAKPAERGPKPGSGPSTKPAAGPVTSATTAPAEKHLKPEWELVVLRGNRAPELIRFASGDGDARRLSDYTPKPGVPASARGEREPVVAAAAGSTAGGASQGSSGENRGDAEGSEGTGEGTKAPAERSE